MKRTLVAILSTGCLVLGGCSSAPAAVTTTGAASASPARPQDGASLRELGLSNGPGDFWLPRTLVPTSRIDQPNVVTITADPEQGDLVDGWLPSHLPPGWRLDARGNGSLLFGSEDWQGAWTCSTTVCALTLRHQAR